MTDCPRLLANVLGPPLSVSGLLPPSVAALYYCRASIAVQHES